MSSPIFPAYQRLQAALEDAGIPLDGMAPLVGAVPPFRIDYNAAATDAQRAAGDALAATWDTRDYIAKPLTTIASELAALSSSDKQIVADAAKTFVDVSVDPTYSLVSTMLKMGFNTTQQNTLKLGTVAGLIRQDPRFAVRLGVNLTGDMPIG